MCLEIKGILWEIDVHCSQSSLHLGRKCGTVGSSKKGQNDDWWKCRETRGDVFSERETGSLSAKMEMCPTSERCTVPSAQWKVHTHIFVFSTFLSSYFFPFTFMTQPWPADLKPTGVKDVIRDEQKEGSWVERPSAHISPFFETNLIFFTGICKKGSWVEWPAAHISPFFETILVFAIDSLFHWNLQMSFYTVDQV